MEDNEERIESRTIEDKPRFSPVFFEVGGAMGKIERAIHWATSIIMLLLTFLVLAGIVLSTVRVPGLFSNLLSGKENSLLTLLEFAAEVIMAVELIHVIIAQNMESVIEILMIAFTRELVIKQWSMWELLIGVAIIGGLFAVRKYLVNQKKQ
ncbi:MAG: hypothetical protein ILP16_01250 [Spirochaetales bacterium]|nr:hypothetical protein [Spirochaetales bacterium]